MECIICGNPCEPWLGGGGYGNNPWPWPTVKVATLMMEDAPQVYRCCAECNMNTVIPLRLRLLRSPARP